jgi:hypothetical protein
MGVVAQATSPWYMVALGLRTSTGCATKLFPSPLTRSEYPAVLLVPSMMEVSEMGPLNGPPGAPVP